MRGGWVAVAVGLALAAGCARDATGPANVQLEGIFHLAKINGAALPFLLQQDSTFRVDVTESALTFNRDKTWSETTLYKVNTAGTTTTPSQMVYGTWDLVNSAVELTSPQGFSEHGAIAGTTLTLLDGGFSLVYRR